MRNRLKFTPHFIFVILGLLLLAACNLPAEPAAAPTEAVAGLAYTAAAETIVAQVTASAQAPVADQPQLPSQTSEAPEPPQPPTATLEPTATLTSTPAPSETPSPTPIYNAIYTDDFSDTSLWYTADEDKWGFRYADGGYHITNNILGAAIWSVRGFEYADVGLEVDARRVNGPSDGYFGVVCRFTDDGDYYYALVIADNGYYGILRMDDGKLVELGAGIDENAHIRRGYGETNRVRGVCDGNRLTLYANGEALLEVFDNTYTSGDLGIVAGNKVSGADLDVFFDNFAILTP